MSSLREVALGATPGPWHQDAPMMSQRDERYVGMGPHGDGYRAVVAAPDNATAEFIATFDPPTVLALLDVVELARTAAAYLASSAEEDMHRDTAWGRALRSTSRDIHSALARLPEEVRRT